MLVDESSGYIQPWRSQDVGGPDNPRNPPRCGPRRTPSIAPKIGSSRALMIPLQVSVAGLGDYYGGLEGFSLKRALRKVGKVLKPLAHIGAAIATGGASLAVSASMLAAKRNRESAERINAAQIAAQKEAFAPQPMPAEPVYNAPFLPRATTQTPVEPPPRRARIPWGQPAPSFSTMPTAPAGPTAQVTQTAPSAEAIRSYLPMPTMPSVTRYSDDGGGMGPQLPQQPQPQGAPAWAIPAALAGAAALLLFSRKGQS